MDAIYPVKQTHLSILVKRLEDCRTVTVTYLYLNTSLFRRVHEANGVIISEIFENLEDPLIIALLRQQIQSGDIIG